MKCPKCGYLGFEAVDRCRNCGYDFSLSAPMGVPEPNMRGASTRVDPLEDIELLDGGPSVVADTTRVRVNRDLDDVFEPRGPELPLFGPPIDDDVPLITKASAPRAPLAVRRATPEIPRLRVEQPRLQSLDLELDEEPDVIPNTAVLEPPPRPLEPGEAAPIGMRATACALDAALIVIVDLIVLYFTLQICGIGAEDLAIVPKAPFLAFLAVQNLGYLVSFTAGGQTLGKMAVGLRVVASEADAPVDIGRALVRTLMWCVLLVPAGLGFLTVALNADHRGLHDRLAGTRVVRAES